MSISSRVYHCRMTKDRSPAPAHANFQMDPDISPALHPYATLVRFLGEMLGSNTEVLLHDTSDFARSIVAIANNHISGRSVGGPATDLVLRIWQSRGYESSDFLVNYRSGSGIGSQVALRSSTYFIRDQSGRDVIGLLCFNVDTSELLTIRGLLDQMIGLENAQQLPTPVDENLSPTLDELTSTSIGRALRAVDVEPARMTKDEKIALVKQLVETGVFLVRGSVAQVAETLQVSEPTVYRYITIATKSGPRSRA